MGGSAAGSRKNNTKLHATTRYCMQRDTCCTKVRLKRGEGEGREGHGTTTKMQQREIAMQRLLVAPGGVNPRVRLYSRRGPGWYEGVGRWFLRRDVITLTDEVATGRTTESRRSSLRAWSVFRAKHVLAFLIFVCSYLLVVNALDVEALKIISCVCDFRFAYDLRRGRRGSDQC